MPIKRLNLDLLLNSKLMKKSRNVSHAHVCLQTRDFLQKIMINRCISSIFTVSRRVLCSMEIIFRSMAVIHNLQGKKENCNHRPHSHMIIIYGKGVLILRVGRVVSSSSCPVADDDVNWKEVIGCIEHIDRGQYIGIRV